MFAQTGNYILRYLFFMAAIFCLTSCENNLKTVSLITANDKNLPYVEKDASIFYTRFCQNEISSYSRRK